MQSHIYTANPFVGVKHVLSDSRLDCIDGHLRTAKHVIELKECIEGITTENVIELLQVVERFPNKKGMKEGCFNFIGVHAKELLGNPAIVQFAASHPKMWKEVGAHMKNPNTTNLQCITEDLSLDEKSIKFPKLHKIKKMKKRK